MEAMEEINEMNRPMQLPEDINMSACANVGDRAEQMLLAPPEYDSFHSLAAKMTEVVPGGYCKILIIEEGDGPFVPVNAEVEFHYAAYWENQTVPFVSSVTTNMGTRKKMRIGDGEIYPVVDTALSLVRGPAARLMLLAPVRVQGRQYIKDALFVISLYSVKMPETLPLEKEKKCKVNVKTVYMHELFEGNRREPTVKHRQSMTASWARNFEEEFSVKRLKTAETDSLSILQNFDYLTDANNYCKALFYCGKACQSSGRTQNASEFFEKALALEPSNHVITSTLAQLDLDNYLEKLEVSAWDWGFSMVLKRKSYYFDVDWDFEYSIRSMYRDLEKRNKDITVLLPIGLSNDEKICVRSLATDFEGLAIKEKSVGLNTILTVVCTRLIRNMQ